MTSNTDAYAITRLENWLQTNQGRYVNQEEKAHFASLTADIFGIHALQIGLPQIDTLTANRIPYRWISNSHQMESKTSTIALTHDFSALPFSSQSMDLIILPHVIEYANEPHQILREIERVLMPEGQLIIVGFNPLSAWRLRHTLGKPFSNHFLPTECEFIRLPRLKDWLKLLGMEILSARYACYRPPFTNEHWLARFEFMDKLGPHLFPYLGAIYIIKAIKRVRGMRLIGAPWSLKKNKAAKGIPASQKYPSFNS